MSMMSANKEESKESIREIAKLSREQSRKLQSLSFQQRKNILLLLSKKLIEQQKLILNENDKDILQADKQQMNQAQKARLVLNEKKLKTLSDGIKQIAESEDPIGKELKRTLIANGLQLSQIAALSIKSGNGGSEAFYSNNILYSLTQAAIEEGSEKMIQKHLIKLFTTREEISTLLAFDDVIDLVIPRGSSQLVKYIQSNTKIPVMGHSEGICHVYVDQDADIIKAIQIILDSKNDYPAACNAMETLLIAEPLRNKYVYFSNKQHKNTENPQHQDQIVLDQTKFTQIINAFNKCKSPTENEGSNMLSADTKLSAADVLIFALQQTGVEVFAGPNAAIYYNSNNSKIPLQPTTDLHHEYSDLQCCVELVSEVDSAIAHINKYSSGHTDSIITENKANAQLFTQLVDSACVFVNASTRFADGYRFGLGAEVGISTGRLHARGPVGVEGLTTTKWVLQSADVHTLHLFNAGQYTYIHKSLPVSGDGDSTGKHHSMNVS